MIQRFGTIGRKYIASNEQEEEEFKLFWLWHGECKRPFLTLKLVKRFLSVQKEINEEEIHLINHQL